MRAAEHLENASPILKEKALAALAIAKAQEAAKIKKGARYVTTETDGITSYRLSKK